MNNNLPIKHTISIHLMLIKILKGPEYAIESPQKILKASMPTNTTTH